MAKHRRCTRRRMTHASLPRFSSAQLRQLDNAGTLALRALALDPADASALAGDLADASEPAVTPADACPMVRERVPADGAQRGTAERRHSQEHCDARAVARYSRADSGRPCYSSAATRLAV